MRVLDGPSECVAVSVDVMAAMEVIAGMEGGGTHARVECCGLTFTPAPFHQRGSPGHGQPWWGLIRHRAARHRDYWTGSDWRSSSVEASPDGWVDVSRSDLCPLCGLDHWCRKDPDGDQRWCPRTSADLPGWRMIRRHELGGIFVPC